MQETKEKIVLVRETTVSSVIQDIVTFGIIIVSFYLNHKFINDNGFLEVILFISFFTMSIEHLKNYKRLDNLTKE